MTNALPDLVARIRIDTSALKNVDAEAKNATSRIGGAFKGMAGTIGAAFAGIKVAGFLNDAVGQFAALEDAVGAAGVVFGKSSKDIEAFAKTAAQNFGLSRRQAVEAANTFGTFGKSAGLAGKDLATFSTDLTGLAGNLASFKGTTTEEAIMAIGSAMRGETEPIRKYGVLLDDASIRQEALAQGLIRTTKDALTPQQKVLAVQALLYKQTGDAQGDFARTSDSTANTQKRLAAETENAKIALGEKLAPAFTFVREAFLGLIKTLGVGVDAIAGFVSTVGGAAKAVVGFLKDNEAAMIAFSAVITATVVPALAKFAVAQAAAFGTSAVGHIRALVGHITAFAATSAASLSAVGSALFGLSGGMAALAGGGVLLAAGAAIAGLVLLFKNMGKEAKLSKDEVKAFAGQLAKLEEPISAADLTDVFTDNKIKVAELSEELDDFYSELNTPGRSVEGAARIRGIGAAFDDVDEALATLVKNGNAKTAESVLGALAKQLGTSREELLKIPGVLDDYSAALVDNAASADLAKAAAREQEIQELRNAGVHKDVAEAVTDEKDAYDQLNEAIDKNAETLQRATDPLFNSYRAHNDYENALVGVQEQLAENAASTDSLEQKQRNINDRYLDSITKAHDYAAAQQRNKEIEAGLGPLRDAQISHLSRIRDEHGKIPPVVQVMIDKLREASNTKVDITPKFDGTPALGALSEWIGEMRARLTNAFSNVKTGLTGIGGRLAELIPGRAIGGPVTAGQAYIVGERGPELFVPGRSGGIIPNHAVPSGNTYQVSIYPQQANLDEFALMRVLQRIERAS